MSKENLSNIFLLILLSFIVAFFLLSYIVLPQKSFSDDENRMLQTFPSFSFEKLLSGKYTRQLHDYFSDQISLRKEMIELKAKTELLMGKNENNGILLGKDGYLIETYGYTNDNYYFLENNLSKIEKLITNIEKIGTKSYSVIIPRKVDVLKDKFPPYYSDARNKAVWSIVNSKHISLKKSLLSKQKEGFDVFYKTDHHLTSEGTYFVYSELADVLSFTPHQTDYFDLNTLSSDFHGTSYSKSGFFFLGSDTIKAPNIEKGKYKITIVDTGVESDSPYDISYLSKKDKYGVFLSGNNAHVKIYDTQNVSKETLLLIKDSFSHSLAPFLCKHYNLELIDPRYYSGSIEEYIRQNGIKKVLFLFGIDTLASANITIR